ncbi:MAG: zf-HC2 domain-containing protein, partial [Armatimonadetes bacterium]|nr:zf-HC2 domain-containing protein [Armatimonadota bacterium]
MRRRRYSEADLRAMIPLYLDGALDAADRAQVEAYYLQHPEVLTQFGESSRMIELLDDAVIVQPADPAFTTDVLGEVARLRPLPRLWQQLPPCPPVTALRWATEIALLVTLLVLLWMHPWAPPINPLECHLLGDETWTLGQPAGVRVVVRHEGRGRELPSATVRLSLHRERWRRTLLRARTNDQGTVDVDLQLDPDITAGNYLLVGEAEALGARATVSHRVRIMPRVTVAVTPLAAGFVVGDPLLVRVTATDGARRPVDQPLPWRLATNSGVLLARGVVTPRLGQALLQVETSGRLPAGRVALLVESPHGSVSVPLQLLPRLADELRIEAPD